METSKIYINPCKQIDANKTNNLSELLMNLVYLQIALIV